MRGRRGDVWQKGRVNSLVDWGCVHGACAIVVDILLVLSRSQCRHLLRLPTDGLVGGV